MKSFLKFLFVIFVAILIAILFIVILYFVAYRHQKTNPITPQLPEVDAAKLGENDLSLYLPENGEQVRDKVTTVAGKSIYSDWVLLVTSSGQYIPVKPEENGSFSAQVTLDAGPNAVAVYAFPPSFFARSKRNTFYYLPGETLVGNEKLYMGQIRHVATDYFFYSTPPRGYYQVFVKPLTNIVVYDGPNSQSTISASMLSSEEWVSVIASESAEITPAAGEHGLLARKVMLRAMFESYDGLMESASQGAVLKPRYAWSPPLKLKPYGQMKVMRFNPKSGNLTEENFESLAPDQKVVLDARNIPQKLDEVYTRAIIILDN